MKPKEILYIFLAALAFAAMGFYVYQVQSENNGLKKSIERIDGQLELQKEQNQMTFDSLQLSIDHRDIELEKLKSHLPVLENRIEFINRKSNENKNVINRITNADSLAMYLTRRYRQ